MSKRPTLVVLTLLLSAAAAAPAAAQSIDSPYRFIDESQYLGLVGGYMLTDAGAIGLGPGDSPYGAIRYGIRVSGPFNIEVEAGFLPASRQVLSVDTLAPDSVLRTTVVDEDADASLLNLAGTLRFDLTGPRTYHGLTPYVLFGVGVAIDLTGQADADANLRSSEVYDFGTSFAGHLGGGIEWFPSRRITFRVDARDVLWKIESPPAFLRGNAPTDEWVQNFQITAGLAYRF